jgi:SPP1 gp7 family putative phage head morphogenesis protein
MTTASRQANELARLERIAALEIRKTLTEFRIIAVRRLTRGDSVRITQQQTDRLVNAFANALTAADNLGVRRARINAKVMRAAIDDDPKYPKYRNKALQLVTGYSLSVNDEIETFTRDLARQGLPTSAMISLLEQKFQALGVSPSNSYQLENLVRTQTQVTYGAAKFREEQQDYIQDILWGYRYSTVGDNRVREEHARLEGVTLPKDDPFWLRFYPPNGWSCRCQVIPLFEKQIFKRPRGGEPEIDPNFATTPDQL